MKKLYEAIFEAMVIIGLLVVVGFWLGVGLFLGVRAAYLY